MRTIKFRGKRVDNGEWVYGHVVEISFGQNKISTIQSASIDFKDSSITGHCDDVIPETVGQFTGLTDKNGKEIYEGDVVRHILQGNRVVYYPFSYDTASFGLLHTNGFANLLTNALDLYEVIGNIHDNPEILK